MRVISYSDLEALSEQGQGKKLPKNAVILSKKDLEGKVEQLADGSSQIKFSDLVLIGDQKEKGGTITPQASVCAGASVCDCQCGSNLILRVTGIPITCLCSCDPFLDWRLLVIIPADAISSLVLPSTN